MDKGLEDVPRVCAPTHNRRQETEGERESEREREREKRNRTRVSTAVSVVLVAVAVVVSRIVFLVVVVVFGSRPPACDCGEFDCGRRSLMASLGTEPMRATRSGAVSTLCADGPRTKKL